MAVTQYIGARYVPIFAEPAEWDNAREYEPLTIVVYQGNSYTSAQAVPVGIDITNESFWKLTGNYNAQVEQYRREVADFSDRIDAADEKATEAGEAAQAVAGDLATEVQDRADADAALKSELEDELAAEVQNRTAADAALKSELEQTIADDVASINQTIQANVEALEAADAELDARLSSVETSLYHRPETYGAVGDGDTDDTDAIQAAIDAAVADPIRNVVLFSANNYRTTRSLEINGRVMFVSIAEQVQFPRILADFDDGYLLHVNAAGFAMQNIILRASTGHEQKVGGILYDTPRDIDSIINKCKFMMLSNGLEASGRSLVVKNMHFSNCHNGAILHEHPTNPDDSTRSYIFTDNRFHSYGVGTSSNDGHGIVFDFGQAYYQNSVYIANNYIDRGSSSGAFIYGDIVTGYISNNEFSITGDRFVELHSGAEKKYFPGELLAISNNQLTFRDTADVQSAIKITGESGSKAYRVAVTNNVFSNVDGAFVEFEYADQLVVSDNTVMLSAHNISYLVKASNCADLIVSGNKMNPNNTSGRELDYLVNATSCSRMKIYGNDIKFKNACNAQYFPYNNGAWQTFKGMALAAGDFIEDFNVANANEILARVSGTQNIVFYRRSSGDFISAPVFQSPTLATAGKLNLSNNRLTVVELYTFNPSTGEKIATDRTLSDILDVR